MTYRIKVVPKNKPNSDGRWITVDRPHHDFSDESWADINEFFDPVVPDDHFLVKWERLR